MELAQSLSFGERTPLFIRVVPVLTSSLLLRGLISKRLSDDRLVRLSDMHCTLIYSRAPIDHTRAMKTLLRQAHYEARVRKIDIISNEMGTHLIADLDCKSLEERHAELRRLLGASHDYPEYRPHTTLAHIDTDEGLNLTNSSVIKLMEVMIDDEALQERAREVKLLYNDEAAFPIIN